MQEMRVRSLSQEDPPGLATHSRTLTWKIPWTDEPGGLLSMRSWRAGHKWVTEHVCMPSSRGRKHQCHFLNIFCFFSSKLPFILYWLPNSPLWVSFPDWLSSPLCPDMLDCSSVLVLRASQLLSRLYFLFMLSHLAVESEQGLLVSLHED